MDLLVVSPCSKDKRYDPVLNCEAVDEGRREELVQEHSEHVTTAADMYVGAEHQHVKTAVDELSDIASVDWYIISAGFGVLGAEVEIPSYECGFSRENIESVRARTERAGYDVDELTNSETIRAIGHEKQIPHDFRRILSRGYDLLFVVLSEPYLLSVSEALTKIPERTTAFAFASKGSKRYIGDCFWVPATETERQALKTTWMELRGKQLREIASAVDSEEVEQLVKHPDRAAELIS